MRSRLLLGLSLFLICWAPALLACSAKGPADPETGLITYPPGSTAAPPGAQTVLPPGLEGTPFQNTIFKGWLGGNTKLIVVPVGTKLGFEGVIKAAPGVNPEPPQPPEWEEGVVQNVKGTTVADAPKPTWTIAGNGRGDYRDGNRPPADPSFSLKPFEREGDCMIVEDTPAVKATWKLTYDAKTAKNMICALMDDPVYGAYIETLKTATSPFKDISKDKVMEAGDPTNEHDATKWTDAAPIELSAVNCGSVAELKTALRTRLCHNEGDCTELVGPETRRYLDPNVPTGSYTKTLPAKACYTVKAGYVAMQEWYATGQYKTKFLVTPPSGTVLEKSGATFQLDCKSPTSPDYWVVDVNSGLESAKDCVWAWIECTGDLKPDGESVPVNSPTAAYYTADGSFKIGGVMVRGLYESGQSSQGRNTQVYVVVADTQPPAKFDWLTPSSLKGIPGKPLRKDDQDGNQESLKIRVWDNNPVIGASTFNNIKTLIPEVETCEFYSAGKRQSTSPNSDAFNRYVQPTLEGFDADKLKNGVAYNVCVPSYIGLKCSEENLGPVPGLKGRVVVPSQRFLWKNVPLDIASITNRKIYNAQGAEEAGLKDLQDEFRWEGYSSFDLEIPFSFINEPLGYNFAEKSAKFKLAYGDAKLTPPPSVPTNGTPAFSNDVQFYPWSERAYKILPICGDGSGNQSPSPNQVASITQTKFSGLDIGTNTISLWDDPQGTLETPPQIKENVKGGYLIYAETTAKENWGTFGAIGKVEDRGKPNIALEIFNSKNNKRVIYGNLMAAGNDNYWKAMKGAGTADWCVSPDTNAGSVNYDESDFNEKDTAWEFRDKIEEDIYEPFQIAIEAERFRPWLYSIPESRDLGVDIWGANYWNGQDTYSNQKIAYQHDSREPLVFRYYTWDNVNAFNWQDPTAPNGVMANGMVDPKFKGTAPNDAIKFVTADIRMVNQPVFGGTNSGLVPVNEFWPEYTFHNPTQKDSGTYQEASITLTCVDQSNNSRKLKVYFRIAAPSIEVIRTLEDKREKK